MKDLLKDFTIKKTLRQLSDDCIDVLLAAKANCSSETLASLRGGKPKKSKTAVLEAIAAIVRENADCVRALRVAYFFHKNRSAFVGLRSYFASKSVTPDWEQISKGKSEAEQSLLLYLEHTHIVADYFVICLHTHQGKSHCSCRTDYVAADKELPEESVLAQLKDALLSSMKGERGSRYCGTRSFTHDGKIFLMLEFDDLPSHQREFEDGKDTAEDKFRRLALDLVYVFDPTRQTVETIAETAELRLLMHRACAAVVYNQQDISARPPKNEIFDLQKLLEHALAGKPLMAMNTESNVKQAYLDSLRIKRSRPPCWETTLSLKIPVNHAEHQRDWVKEAQNLVRSIVNVKDDPGGWWHKSYVQATHAELMIVYWDAIEGKDVSKTVTVNSSGGTNLSHIPEDEAIKAFLRESGLLKTPADEGSDAPQPAENREEELV